MVDYSLIESLYLFFLQCYQCVSIKQTNFLNSKGIPDVRTDSVHAWRIAGYGTNFVLQSSFGFEQQKKSKLKYQERIAFSLSCTS